MTTYYVSAEIGSNSNAGTSVTAPLATLQAAADLVQPGDTVEVMNGTYKGALGGDVVDITTSGTASAPITFEAAPGQTPVINSSGCWNGIKIEGSYIVVSGFTIVGDAANYTLSQALAGYSTGNAYLDGAGICVLGNPGVNVPNHITIENNTVYNEPGGGIGSGYADYLNILNNDVYDNAHWSAFGNSGISITTSVNSDTKSGVHDIISGNLVFGNAQLVPTSGAGKITDGEGIILDTNTGFEGEILIENNTVYGNGSAGIESFRTNGAVITENTVYGNNTGNVLQTASADEIAIDQSSNTTVTNNITTAPDLSPPTISSLTESPSSGDLNAGKTVTYTITMSEAVTVAGATPTLTLNDGGTAKYTGGSGTNALTFSYTVGASDSDVAALSAIAINLNGATIQDEGGNDANFSLTGLTQSGPQIDITPPPSPIVISDKVIGKRVVLSGTEDENGIAISIYDGTALLGTTTTSSEGTWVYTAGQLANGTHVVTATATDAAGNVSAASSPDDPNIGAGPSITAAPIQVGNQFYIYNSSGAGLALSYTGTTVAEGQFGNWTPIAATQTTNGYEVAWQNTSTGQYTVWTTDSNGNYTGNVIGAVAGNSYALESFESVFNQDLNGDGVTGLKPLVIQTDTNSYGSTSLGQIGNNYFLFAAGGTSGPELQYNRSAVTSSEFGNWKPIGTVQTTNGYEVAWQNTSTGQYTVWTTDSNGNYTGNVIGAVAGNSYALESFESVFNQDLNGDGVTGLNPLVIQTDTNSYGSTSLGQIGNNYFLFAAGGTSGPELQYNGSAVTSSEFGNWKPIGTVQTTNGYEVAWQNTSTGQYTVWTTDSNGNYTGNVIGAVAGNSYALESFESVFNQDLNGDGVTGLNPLVIQTDTNSYGSTSLGQIGNNYFLFAAGGTSGPELQYNGSAVTSSEFGNWKPIGTVQTTNGYEVAWQNTSTGQYTVWTTDSNGNYTGNVIGAVAGNSYALESFESVFNQDLNGDDVTGLYAATGTTLKITQSLATTLTAATIASGGTLELDVADSTSVTFAASTGQLKLEQPSSFTGEIFNFSGDGALSGSDQIDLQGINYSTVQDTYAAGVLTVTDGSGNRARLNFSGSYTLANFSLASDVAGGTIVYDPPVATSNALTSAPRSATIGNGAILESAIGDTGSVKVTSTRNFMGDTQSATNSFYSANLALLSSYMASTFAMPTGAHYGTLIAEATAPNGQLLLSNPYHA